MSLLIPFEYEFFRNGFIAAVLVGGLCGFIGVYVVLRRMSYIGHGLSHAIFGGAVLSYVVNINFFLGAGLWALIAAYLIHRISHRRWVGADAAIGVVTTSSFALGVAIVSTYRTFTRNIEAALFGKILGVTLVAAAMVIPPVIGRYLTKRFQTLLIISPLIGMLCSAVGMYLSFYLDISSAAT